MEWTSFMGVGEVSSPGQVWYCGEKETGQDVTIILLPSENTNEVEAELKMHSSVLKQFSKYFEVALNERWSNPSASSALMIFSLEMISGVPMECYIDCFKRMYVPLMKVFQDVESSLHLLRPASQIVYDKLTMDICGYLSAKRWSQEEEVLIRQYASSEDFPSSQAKDLMVRLSMDGPTRTNDQKKLSDVVEETIRVALGRGRDDPPTMSMKDARSFIDALLAGIHDSVKNPEFYMDMMSIINGAIKELLVEFEAHCRQHGLERHVVATQARLSPGFELGLEAICWILDNLMKANNAEEGVGWFLQLELYPKIFEVAVYTDYSMIDHELSKRIERLVLLMHENAASGQLVLEESARVKLFQHYDLVTACGPPGFSQVETMMARVLRAKEDVFHTLSLRKQMELVQQGVCSGLILPSTLAGLVKEKWAASHEERRHI